MCKDLHSSVVETDFFELINYSVLRGHHMKKT